MDTIGKRHRIDSKLEGVLSHFYTIKMPLGIKPSVWHLSPSLEMMVVFNFGPPVRFSFGEKKIGERVIDRIGMIGPLRQMMNYELTEGADLLVLPFIYNGFYRLFSLPIDHFNLENEDEVLGYTEKLVGIWKQLLAISDTETRVTKVTDYLLASISKNDKASLTLLENVPAIHNPAVNPVKVMAAAEAVSERSIQLRFKKYTGYSPKELIRFLRFKAVITGLSDNPDRKKIDWMDLVLKHGYYDQSHLIKDFNYYTGVSPEKFLILSEEGDFCVGSE